MTDKMKKEKTGGTKGWVMGIPAQSRLTIAHGGHFTPRAVILFKDDTSRDSCLFKAAQAPLYSTG